MTPRQIDVAFVLEDAAGVREVYALASTPSFDFMVVVDHGTAVVARAHYALLRVLTHEECGRVLFVQELPATFGGRATRLVLGPREREAARARVPRTSPALEEVAPRRESPLADAVAVLVVESGDDIASVVGDAFTIDVPRVVASSVAAAVAAARERRWDVILCDSGLAFGSSGLLASFWRARISTAPVVILASADAYDGAAKMLRRLGVYIRLGAKPLTPEALLTYVTDGHADVPGPPRAEPLLAPLPARRTRRVLVVDDDRTTQILLGTYGGEHVEVTVTGGAWEAVAASAGAELVVCSSSMRTPDGDFVYRFLWKLAPDVKRKTVLLAPAGAPSALPASRRGNVVDRPLTFDTLGRLLAARDAQA